MCRQHRGPCSALSCLWPSCAPSPSPSPPQAGPAAPGRHGLGQSPAGIAGECLCQIIGVPSQSLPAVSPSLRSPCAMLGSSCPVPAAPWCMSDPASSQQLVSTRTSSLTSGVARRSLMSSANGPAPAGQPWIWSCDEALSEPPRPACLPAKSSSQLLSSLPACCPSPCLLLVSLSCTLAPRLFCADRLALCADVTLYSDKCRTGEAAWTVLDKGICYDVRPPAWLVGYRWNTLLALTHAYAAE